MFMESLRQVLEALTNRVFILAAQDLQNAYISQVYGIFLLCFVMVLSPILIVLARNGITSIQVENMNRSSKAFGFVLRSKDLLEMKGTLLISIFYL